MTILYISGPMTGYAEHNFPEFERVAKALRAKGYTVLSPHEFPNAGKSWVDCLRYDLVRLMECSGVATLDGWSDSRGAGLEVCVAEELEMTVKPWEQWL